MVKKKGDEKTQIKNKLKKQVDATNEKAEIFNGEKSKIGKYQTINVKPGSNKSDQADLDKFFKSVEEGFTDLSSVKARDKKPYDGLLGKVEVERLIKTTNK